MYWLDLLLKLLLVLSLIALRLKDSDVPAGTWWSNHAYVYWFAIIFFSLGSASVVVEAVWRRVVFRRDRAREQMHRPLVTLYRDLLRLLGPENYRDLVVTAFLKKLSWRLPNPIPRWELKKQKRAGLKIRPSSAIHWTRGKGLIGACWLSNMDAKANFKEDWNNELLRTKEDEWSNLGNETTYGLNAKERDWTAAYIEGIVATPIQEDGKFVGCISVDCPQELVDKIWNNREAKEAMQVAAGLIAALRKGSSPD